MHIGIIIGLGGGVGFPVGTVRGRRRLFDDSPADLLWHSACGRRLDRGKPDRRLIGIRAYWCICGAAMLISKWVAFLCLAVSSARRLASCCSRPALNRPDRSGDQAVLCRLSRDHWRADAGREPAHHHASASRAARVALHQHNWLMWSALQDAFSPLEALHQRHPAAGHRRLCRRSGSDHGCAGGGFIMVPAMIYLLGMPTSVLSAPRCSRSFS